MFASSSSFPARGSNDFMVLRLDRCRIGGGKSKDLVKVSRLLGDDALD